jgi:HEXXH motif-containing protein
VRDVCGGGSYAHRYRPGHGYRNPSVYCRELERLIRHIGGAVHRDLAGRAAPRQIRRHRLPVAHFDALAAGEGDRTTVELLRDAVLSKQLLRLRALIELAGPLDSAGFELLADAQAEDPGTVAELLRYPHVVAWAAACLRRLRRERDDHDGPGADPAHLGGVAAVAALRAGMETTVTVPVRGGTVALPTLGRAEVGPPDLSGTAVVRSGPAGAEISTGHRTVRIPEDPGTDAPGWRGLRRLRAEHAGQVLQVHLDDLDPFRDNHRLGPAPRLPDEAVESWRRALQGAWSILVRHHPRRAEAIAAGLTAFVPLATHGGRRGLSATSAEAPGAIAMTPPGDALLLAESLVHEFQHVKLCAVMDMLPLHAPDDGERFYAPWREDPRPLGGVLHGAYAYLAVTDFWGRQQEAMEGDEAAFAQYSFALWRGETLRTVGVIERSGRLTPAGERFVTGMRTALERWAATPVTPTSRASAEDTALDLALTWRLRHLRPDPGAVERLAGAWPVGAPEPLTAPATLEPSDRRPGTRGHRTELRHLRLRFPAEFRRLCTVPAPGPPLYEADLAHVSGDTATAIDLYRARLEDDPLDVEAWSGLAVSARRAADDLAGPAAALCTHPEVVTAVYRRVGELGTGVPDPLELAGWLGPAVRDAPRGWTGRAAVR